MNPTVLLLVILAVQSLVVGGLLLIQPYVTRRGLLFGVYVGEEAWDGPEARAITTAWTRGLVTALVVSLVLAVAVAFAGDASPARVTLAGVGSLLLLVLYSYVAYLGAYRKARHLAVVGAPAAASLVRDLPHSLAVPLTALVVATCVGVAAVAYAALHYAQMPAEVPTHFGFSGAPDAWSPRSFGAVMMLPMGALFMGVSLALIACLTARAKRAIRVGDAGVSLAAQVRFRNAMATFLGGVAVLVSLMMGLMSVFSVRTAMGLASGMPAAVMVLTLVLLVYALGGSIYLAVRFGQGGSKLEGRTSAPLSNGLADNAHWVLGMFYVNRDDPSFMVEKRFGIGYTLNFGNPKAVALLVVFLAFILYTVVSGLMMPQTSGPAR